MFDRWGVINVRQTELCIIKLQQNHHTNKSEPTVVRIAPSPTPSWQTLDRRFIQDRRYTSTKPIYDKIKRLIKPRSTSIQPERSQCGIRCDCKTQKKHGYLAEGKRTGTDGYRGEKKEKNKQPFRVLPEIVARQWSIFKGALLVQLCMSWCATLVPKLEEWFPVERAFTIDRQGRANRISIGGDYWATWGTRAAQHIYLTVYYTTNTYGATDCFFKVFFPLWTENAVTCGIKLHWLSYRCQLRFCHIRFLHNGNFYASNDKWQAEAYLHMHTSEK